MSVEAPERIFIAPNRAYTNPWGRPLTTDDFDDEGVEYVRADKLEELELHVRHADAYLQSAQGAIQRAEAAEAALAEAKRENEVLRELVDSAESIFINCSVTDGMCCCGDNMENHPSPMTCGHTPVDHGAYQVDLWIKARNAGGKYAE